MNFLAFSETQETPDSETELTVRLFPGLLALIILTRTWPAKLTVARNDGASQCARLLGARPISSATWIARSAAALVAHSAAHRTAAGASGHIWRIDVERSAQIPDFICSGFERFKRFFSYFFGGGC